MASAGAPVSRREVALAYGAFELEERGEGSPVVYLHGMWDGAYNPLVDALAIGHHVLEPKCPGFGETTGEAHLRSVGDAVVFYLDLFDALGLEDITLVGHCLGGMFAAELAAAQPQRFASVVLVAPYGVWDDDDPGLDAFVVTPEDSSSALDGARRPLEHHSLLGPAPLDFEGLTDSEVLKLRLARSWALAGAARFIWPIPDRGLVNSRTDSRRARSFCSVGRTSSARRARSAGSPRSTHGSARR